jgi:hypothetical protein
VPRVNVPVDENDPRSFVVEPSVMRLGVGDCLWGLVCVVVGIALENYFVHEWNVHVCLSDDNTGVR